ncbi:trihelix transcription factor GTL1-like [Senna tora]|uniref:Trihelix transcription factor GTL1-like n=1 Tax=Senna tora TaxID=362788 RepID=A0A834W0B1_9FABA|nr:trihelix transcription factor GTL1-like [Senna tora]
MDLFTGDDFPDHVTPFPDTSDFLCAQQITLIHPSEVITDHHRPPPPQKLRPIRCNGRSSPVGGLSEDSRLAVTSTDVGFLSNQLCVDNGEPSYSLQSLGQQVEDSEAIGNGRLRMEKPVGDGSGHNWDPNNEEGPMEQESGFGAWMDAIKHPSCQREALTSMRQRLMDSLAIFKLFYVLMLIMIKLIGSINVLLIYKMFQHVGWGMECSSSDDDENSFGSTKEPGIGKRRKKTMKKLEVFLEHLVRKVMEKQEEMHKQLMDLIEKKERERVMREEAWRQKEMERIKREEEARLQEKSRNLALISFIQNLLGHEIEIPQPVSSLRADDEGEANIQQDLKIDLSSNNNRWPEAEVQALITLRTSLEHKFQLMGPKGSIWEEISEAMQNMGYNRSAKKCKEKWENINKYYKRTIGSGKKRRLNSKTCPYFDELDILYRNGLLNVGNGLSSTNKEDQLKVMDDSLYVVYTFWAGCVGAMNLSGFPPT